ncbi:MAG: hypothetical protein SPF22_07950 [Candidatus Onthovivens sp.]|nr:hypothetical protein [Candidatus Onthovivens sp.]
MKKSNSRWLKKKEFGVMVDNVIKKYLSDNLPIKKEYVYLIKFILPLIRKLKKVFKMRSIDIRRMIIHKIIEIRNSMFKIPYDNNFVFIGAKG